jgi:hypothetical protein
MGFSLRTVADNLKFPEAVSLNALEHAIPQATVEAVVVDLGVEEQRTRKLPAALTLLLCIAMGLFANLALSQVPRKLVQGVRYIWPADEDDATANKSAISQARYRLGARPVVALFHRICRPVATEHTAGAFLFGLRLMAIDGTTEDVPDTPANAAFFGRHQGDRGDSAFPQMRAVYLCEVGTHAICDAGFWPCHTSERVGGLRLLRSVGPGMLLMWTAASTASRWRSPRGSAARSFWAAYLPTSSPSSCARCRMAPTWPTSIRPTTRVAGKVNASWCGWSSTR